MKIFIKTYIVLIFGFGLGCKSISNQYESPLLQPTDVISAVEDYIVREKPSIKLDNYYVESLSFNFTKRQWFANYMCTDGPKPPGCHFSVYMSDTKPSKFSFWGGV